MPPTPPVRQYTRGQLWLANCGVPPAEFMFPVSYEDQVKRVLDVLYATDRPGTESDNFRTIKGEKAIKRKYFSSMTEIIEKDFEKDVLAFVAFMVKSNPDHPLRTSIITHDLNDLEVLRETKRYLKLVCPRDAAGKLLRNEDGELLRATEYFSTIRGKSAEAIGSINNEIERARSALPGSINATLSTTHARKTPPDMVRFATDFPTQVMTWTEPSGGGAVSCSPFFRHCMG